jgi:hypothetical protein
VTLPPCNTCAHGAAMHVDLFCYGPPHNIQERACNCEGYVPGEYIGGGLDEL